MTRDDAYAFSDALRAAFPRIRFVSYDYAKKFLDYKAWKKACDEAEKAGHEKLSLLDHTRDPDDELPDYFPTLGDVLEDRFWVWIEPPNWRPRWRKRKRADILVIENFPQLHFSFFRGAFECPDIRRSAPLEGNPDAQTHGLNNPALSLDRNEPIILTGNRMLGGWTKEDSHAKAFIHKVWRILGKMSTNRLVAVDRRTRQPIPPDGSPTTEPYLRAARHALAWARGRRHNYLQWGWSWFKPVGYFDGPARRGGKSSGTYRR